MSYTKSYALTGERLKRPLYVGIKYNTISNINLVGREANLDETSGTYYVLVTKDKEENLFTRLDSISSKFANGFVDHSFKITDADPGQAALRIWSETPEGASYWTAIWKAAVLSVKISLVDILSDPIGDTYNLFITPIEREIGKAIEEAHIPGGLHQVDAMTKLVCSFYSLDFPTRGESPISGMMADDRLSVAWKLGDKKEYGLKLFPGIVYPIEPQIIAKIDGAATLTLLS